MNSLSTLFSLCAMIAYVLGRKNLIVSRKGWFLILFGTSFFGLLALLSKENAVLIPLYIVCLEYFIFNFRTSHNVDRRILIGIADLRESGLRKVKAGVLSLEELNRVTKD